MGYIPCVSDCKYQKDGICMLEGAFSSSVVSDSGCIHYVPKNLSKYGADKIKKNPSQNTDGFKTKNHYPFG